MSARNRIASTPRCRFVVEVTAAHLDRMYDRFDSGMADHPTQNAIVLALRDLFGTGMTIRTVKLCRDEWGILFDHDTIPLPHVANQWMKLLCDGYLVAPMEFEFVLPQSVERGAPHLAPREAAGVC